MTDIDKVYTPETIDDMPLPLEGEIDLNVSQSTSGNNYSAEKIKNQSFPTKRIAVELLSSALNTRSKKILQEFEFTQSGALQIGEYEDGISGDIRISPNGIVGRNKDGTVTFSLDGTTGDGIFAGTLQTGTLIAGEVVVGNNNVIIDGDNRRIIVNDGTNDRVLIGYQENGF